MNSSREEVIEAFLSLMSKGYQWGSVGRRYRSFEEFPAQEMPALMLIESNEMNAKGDRNLSALTTLAVNLLVYVNTKNLASPSSPINTVLDTFDFLLRGDPMTGKVTLGGLVDHCWVDGLTVKIAGEDDGIGLIWCPIKILGP